MFFKSNVEKAKERKLEEYFFNIVAQELKNGIKHDATWAKAIAFAQGNSEKAESSYIKYRIESLQDDMILNQEAEENDKIQKELERKAYKQTLKKKGIYICQNCHAEVKPIKKKKGSVLILIPLIFLYIVPAIIYALLYDGYIYRCPKCDRIMDID